ncbi:MAG: putative PEP-binding protein, partial [bacterium]
NLDSVSDFKKISIQIQKKIIESEFSGEVNKQITRFYSALSGFSDSYTQIKMAEVSVNRIEAPKGFNYSSYSNVKGLKDVTKTIKAVLASAFTPEYLYYLKTKDISAMNLNYPVLIQKMVQPEISGNLFTVNSYDDNPNNILIEAILGLYDPIQSGEITPDHYVVEKESGKILQKYIVPQEWMLIRKGSANSGEDSNFRVNITKTWQHKQKLEDKYIQQLLKVSNTIEKAFNKKPIEVIWFYESGRVWIYSVSELSKLIIEDRANSVSEMEETGTLADLKRKLGVTGDIKIFKHKEEPKLAEMYVKEEPQKEVKKEEKPQKQEEQLEQVVEEKVVQKEEVQKVIFDPKSYELLLTGSSAVVGSLVGKVKIITAEEELIKIVKTDIAVIESISPKYVSFLKNAGGIILDEAGTINDVVLLAKDYKIPCIVGATIATKILKQGENIGIDATQGKIYEVKVERKVTKEEIKEPIVVEVKKELPKIETKKPEVIFIEPKPQKQIELESRLEAKGLIESEFEKTFIDRMTVKEIKEVKQEVKIEEKKIEKEMEKISKPAVLHSRVETATKIMLSLQDPSSVTLEDVLYMDGVGLFRTEMLLTKYGSSLTEVLTNKELKSKLEENIGKSLQKVSEAFNPKPVIYRLADFKSNEIENTKLDKNPLIGNRGAYSLLNTNGLLEIELEAIRKVRNVDGLKNVWVNIPYARSVLEVSEIKKKILEYGFKRSSSFKIYVSIETPAMAYAVKEIIDLGIDGIIVDTNDLVQLLLGADNSFEGFTSYDIENSGVFGLIDQITQISIKENIPIIVTGNLISDETSESKIKTLIQSGITGISVNKDRINETKEIVANVESSILLSKRTLHKKAKLSFPKRKK